MVLTHIAAFISGLLIGFGISFVTKTSRKEKTTSKGTTSVGKPGTVKTDEEPANDK